MTQTFSELGVPTQLTTVLERDGKTSAFPIQESTLPDSLAGRDVLGRGRTGSGKTLAFSLPVVARLMNRKGRAAAGRPRALILCPTRELATQIDAVIAPLAASVGLTTTTIFGGVNQRRQEQALSRGVDIVVACPGRLEDLMKQRIVSLDQIELTVLDEADHMADLGFLPGVTRIMTATPRRGQRMLFSATLDNGVNTLVKKFLDQPVTHSVDSAESPVEAMTHHVFHVADAGAKRDVVHALASGTGRRVLFMRTKHQAKKMAKQLTADGIPAVDLHGNLSQNARDRNLAAFAAGEAKVLVATDVAARGVHVDGIELVVHVDPPAEHKAYLHRSGRTARAGSEGDVVTLVLPEQKRDTAQLLSRAKISVRPEAVNASSSQVVALIGEVAPKVAPAPVADQPRRQSGGGGRRRGGAQHQNDARQGGRGRQHQNDARPARQGAGNARSNDGRPGRQDAGSRQGQGAGRSGGNGGSGSGAGRSGGAARNRHAGGHSSAASFSAGGGRRRGR
ncbi:DEAD/DEAH box helicase [Demequina sp. SYSU T00039]|uniref:DEAD/DEAH box helicase n=1 Tax=Demequina lignilytica TaxID=3051663 RepID=A0AAW7M1E4_9MICO|nr:MULTISPECIES: DEAD/DEAH box helicase [unclassified Demequina]MDN4477066.1 DEAD/DEAH box helicase [Demequina sp. SYSU T00039-1]MDN4487239.1 DEAD/DEAH box helicase [Demequina sp. SYSU T00039]MDN4491490.1 DEAD/DEAH box helicase [Demequina sp. SYSU T00068]